MRIHVCVYVYIYIYIYIGRSVRHRYCSYVTRAVPVASRLAGRSVNNFAYIYVYVNMSIYIILILVFILILIFTKV